jgi:hypothetical protein
MTRFHYPRNLTAEENDSGELDYYGPLPEGANIGLCKTFFEQLEQYEGKYVDREKFYCASPPCPLHPNPLPFLQPFTP